MEILQLSTEGKSTQFPRNNTLFHKNKLSQVFKKNEIKKTLCNLLNASKLYVLL